MKDLVRLAEITKEVIVNEWRYECGNDETAVGRRRVRGHSGATTYRHPVALHDTKFFFIGAEPALRSKQVCVRAEN